MGTSFPVEAPNQYSALAESVWVLRGVRQEEVLGSVPRFEFGEMSPE